jgi:hypothetical protein
MSLAIYKFGAVGSNDLTTLLQFEAYFTTSDRVSHLQLPFQATGYQVTVGKTLYLVKLIDTTPLSNPAYFKIGYCDNDVGRDSLTARVNPFMAIGTDDGFNNGLGLIPSDPTAGDSDRSREVTNCFIKIAVGGKFPFIHRMGVTLGASILLWGIEL